MFSPVDNTPRVAKEEGTASAERQRKMHELRKANRYQLTALVFFSWRHPDGRFLQLTGVTQDISMRGISFLTADAVEVGAYIELDVYLPSLHRQGRGMKLHGEGTVLRVESLSIVEKKIAAEVMFESEPEATLLAASLIHQ
jgi:hypothetical protein